MNTFSSKVLHDVIQYDYPELIKYLVENGADVNVRNKNNESILLRAARSGYFEIVKYLLDERGMNINERTDSNKTILCLAAESGNLDLVKYLMDEKKMRIKRGNDLCAAARSGNLELVKYLVRKGANINSEDDNGNSILCAAAAYRNIEIVRYLVNNGANINSTDMYGSTALHKAVRDGDLKLVTYLIKNGANVNARDGVLGDSVLHYAAKSLDSVSYAIVRSIIKLLLDNGADPSIKNTQNQTAYDLISKHIKDKGKK